MFKGIIRHRSKRDSKRSKSKRGASDDDIDASQRTDTVTVNHGDTGLISKHDLKEKWRRSELSSGWNEFAERTEVFDADVLGQINREGEYYKFDRLVDHLVEGPDETTVGENVYAAFQAVCNTLRQGVGVGDEQESVGKFEAAEQEEEESYWSQAEDDSDEQEPTTAQGTSEGE